MIKKLAYLSTFVFLLCLLSACGEKTTIKEHDKETLNSLDNGEVNVLIKKDMKDIVNSNSQDILKSMYEKDEAFDEVIYKAEVDMDNDNFMDTVEISFYMKVRHNDTIDEYGFGYWTMPDYYIVRINDEEKKYNIDPIENIEIISEDGIRKLKFESSYREINTYYLIYANKKIHEEKIVDQDGKINVLGQKYKAINEIKQEKLQVDTDRKYVAPTVDELGEKYVKYSDSYESPAEERDGEFVEMDGVELLPTKIYTTNPEDRFLYKYKEELYYIPAVLCEKESDKRIEYRDYGFTLWGDNSVSVNGKKVSDLISGYWNYGQLYIGGYDIKYGETKNFYDAYTSCWKVDTVNKVDDRNYKLTAIYEYDYDGNLNTPELLMPTLLMDHVHIDTSRVMYNLFSVNHDGKFMYSNERILWLAQMPKLKNVFYSERGVCTEGKIYGIKENIYAGYWLYDKNEGLSYVKRLANGEKLDSKKFNETYFSLDTDYYFRGSGISIFYNYTIDDEGNVVFDKNNMLKAGTKVRIKDYSFEDCSMKFVLESGQEVPVDFY